MRSSRLFGFAVAAAALLVATTCAPVEMRKPHPAVEQARKYTIWLYGGQYGRLWERMTPEMHELFAGPAEFGAFVGRAITRLGREQSVVREAVAGGPVEQIYSRTSVFSSASNPVLIQWVLTEDRLVTGLVVRPADETLSKQDVDSIPVAGGGE